MDDRQIKKDTKRVVRKIGKLVAKYGAVGRQEMSAINTRVMEYVHKNTGIGMGRIAEKMGKVLEDLPHEYGQLDEESRSWDALIAYLYMKYLKELGILK